MTRQQRPLVESLESKTTAYINAGGRGTRLASVLDHDPEVGIAKALLEVGDPAIKLLDHHIAAMGRSAFRNIVVGAGDREDVRDYAQTHYSFHDVSVASSQNFDQLGTAGDLILAIRESPKLFGDDVLIKNVDTILDIDDSDFLRRHKLSQAAVSIALTRNRGVPNQDAFYVDSEGTVVYSAEATANPRDEKDATSLAEWRGSSTGALAVKTDFLRDFDWSPDDGQLSLYRHIMGAAILADSVNGYDNGNGFFLDVGTAATWTEAKRISVIQRHLVYPKT